ncbi:MAG TPA: ATP-binding cassette domain-containing protein [Gemmatales bacterium]|nr:ATP-binding cassette domain-containing protein [Gemmatales bacterium]HMP58394.1 ATP-binding cassette domain-containing protein [Gemmatales bacterium]
MISVSHLTKYFGAVLAVDDISFEVARGEVVGFLGPNGAGKSTTMRILTTFLPATTGMARIAGFDVMEQSLEVRQNLGYLPENVPLYPEMRVEEYLSFRARLKGVERSARGRRIDYCIDRCRLAGVRRRLIGTLSRGYRQRVGLAEALIHDPPMLILDEPTAGLDPNQQQDTLGLIRELGEKHTILLSTHILPEVEEVCRRVIIIAQGRIVLADDLANLSRDAVIVVEVRGPEAQVRETLEKTEGVRSVNLVTPEGGDGAGLCGFELLTQDDRDLREAISQRLVKQGWTLRRLDLRRKSLREHFVAVTMMSRGATSAA